MKPGKWLVLFSLIVIATALYLLQKKVDVAAPVSEPAPPAEETAKTKSPATARLARKEAAESAAAATEDHTEQAPLDLEESGKTLQVIVQDENSQPLAGAEIRVSVKPEKGSETLTNFNRTVATSSSGVASVSYPAEKNNRLELNVSKDEYSSRKMIWDIKSGHAVPASYTVKLKNSFHIGGFVVDPEGNPIPEAIVRLSRFWSGDDDRPNMNQGEEPSFLTQRQTTGPDGHWTARNLPPELVDRISIEASHTNFISARVVMDKPQVETELREGVYKIHLKQGLEVRGRVIDEQKRPIANAQVWAGRKYYRERQATKSDADGVFRFRNINEGKVDFSVMAEGFAPDSKSHNVSASAEEIVFQLSKGSVIRGRVQDPSGEPIEGVRVVLEGGSGEGRYDTFEYTGKTDSDGRFEWKSAPNNPVPFYIGKSGYEQKRGVTLKPNEDNVITLNRDREIEGQVLDAETGKPVTQFAIAVGRFHGGSDFYPDDGNKEFKNEKGLFTLSVGEESNDGIQATAKGYAEETQKLPAAEDGKVKIILNLKPSASLKGTVVTSEGQPVSGAGVALVDDAAGGRSVQFSNGKLRSQGSRARVVITDAEGRFEIPSPPEVGTVLASHESGFASATVAEVKSAEIFRLQPFGRIEGTFIQGATAGVGQEFLLSSSNGGMYFDFDSYKQTADAQGRFTFEKVPPGTLSIVRLIKTTARSWSHSHSTEVIVAPGQTTQVTIGGIDATLHGRVRFEEIPSDTEYVVSASLSMASPKIPEGLNSEQVKALLASPQWKEEAKKQKRYSGVVAADGSLILDSVVPGQYTLHVTAQKADEPGFGMRKPLAEGSVTVTVPEGADPANPIQIDEVVLKPSKQK